MSKGFKSEILNNLGEGIKCSTSCVANQRITTFSKLSDDILNKKKAESKSVSNNSNNISKENK